MERLFAEQAEKYHVLPLHNAMDGFPAMAKIAAGNFAAHGGKWNFTGPVSNIPSLNAPPVLAMGFTMTAQLDLPTDVTGPVFAYGSQLGGIGLYLVGGKPTFMASQIDGDTFAVTAKTALPAGRNTLALKVAKGPEGNDGKADYAVTIAANGQSLAQQTFRAVLPRSLVLAETFAVGRDDAAPMLAGYPATRPLDARIESLVFDFNTPR